MTEQFDDYYALLRESPDANPAQLEAAYRRGVRYWHPDNYLASPREFQDEAERMTVKLNRAIEELRVPERKAKYDETYSQRKAYKDHSRSHTGTAAGKGPPNDDLVSLAQALKNAGLDVIDKRPQGGALWIVGGSELRSKLQTFTERDARFQFSPKGGKATRHRPAWFTSSTA